MLIFMIGIEAASKKHIKKQKAQKDLSKLLHLLAFIWALAKGNIRYVNPDKMIRITIPKMIGKAYFLSIVY